MTAAHRRLTSFSAVIETKTTEPDRPVQHTALAFRKPDRVRVQTTVDSRTALAVSDGEAIYLSSSQEGKKYLTLPLGGEDALEEVLRALDTAARAAGVWADGSGLGPAGALMSGKDFQASLGSPGEAKVGPPGVVEETPVDSVIVTFRPHQGPREEARLVLEIGRRDHLLRRLTFGPAGPSSRIATVTQTHTQVRGDPALEAGLFSFSIPRGAKPVPVPERKGAEPLKLVLGAVVIAAALLALARGWDVRLALLLASLTLGTIAGDPMAIVRKFFAIFSDERYVVPICSAMGFAYVLRHTLCDQHLVHLLTNPLRRARPFLIPGAVLVGFLVNVPIVSQTSTAVAIGSVLIPLLLAARISPVTAGATLLLGASMGGELFNPGAPEYPAIVSATNAAAAWSGSWALQPFALTSTGCVQRVALLNLIQVAVAGSLFWALSLRAETRYARDRAMADAVEAADPAPNLFKVSILKAMIPLVPLVILFLIGGEVPKPTQVVEVPQAWLVDARSKIDQVSPASTFDSRLIGAAMLVGVALAAVTARRQALGTMKAFFDGAGYAFANIVAIIVTAACFAEGVKLIGLAEIVGTLITALPALILPVAGLLPLAFAAISGSGIATTQGLFEFFAKPAWTSGIDPGHVGGLVSLAAAAGRTMSPAAAVTLMCAALTETSPLLLVRRDDHHDHADQKGRGHAAALMAR
jgi:C4-dicarboxylate transporter, DcuC family